MESLFLTFLLAFAFFGNAKDAVFDVKMPWFMLGVIYTALFFLLQNKRGGS